MPRGAKGERESNYQENTLSSGVDEKLRNEQAGFRCGGSTIEQIFVLRNIIEQSVEWNASLYICFNDYEKAFDSVHCIHRKTQWRIMTSHFIPPKLERMAQAMYKENKYVVINGGQKLPPVSSPDMGTGREMQESNT